MNGELIMAKAKKEIPLTRRSEVFLVDEYVDLDRAIKALEAEKKRLQTEFRRRKDKDAAKVSFKGTEHYVNVSEYQRTNTDLTRMKEDYGFDIFKPYESQTDCVKLLISHKPKPADA